MKNFKKIDLLLALIIGEVAALLMVLIFKNLAVENIAFGSILPYLNYLLIAFPIACAVGIIAAHLVAKIIPAVYQFAKFVLVGGLNFLIDMGVLNFLVFYTGVAAGLMQTGFKGFSFLFALINSYFWNKFWVFEKKHSEKTGQEMAKFFIVSVIGLLINLGVDYFFVDIVGQKGGIPIKTWAQVSAMIAAAVALFWNFFGYKFFVFKQKPGVNIEPEASPVSSPASLAS